jgi:hypothetical protein
MSPIRFGVALERPSLLQVGVGDRVAQPPRCQQELAAGAAMAQGPAHRRIGFSVFH